MNNLIVFIDSGIGGINILNATKKIYPKLNYLYIKDEKNIPYGNKSLKKLKKIAKNNINNIIFKYNPQIIVLACNTLSVCCLDYLKKLFPNTKFIGTIPKIPKALLNNNKTLLFATKRTVLKIRKIYGKPIKYLYIKNLPVFIEKNINNLENIENIIKKYLNKKKYNNIKYIYLGCTHFIYIKKQINNIAKREYVIIDNCSLVAKEIYENIKFYSLIP